MIPRAIFNQDILQTATVDAVPGRRELNQAFPDLRSHHQRKLKAHYQKCYPEVAVILDGSPTFAEAECIVIRMIERETKRITQHVARVALYAEALNGATIANNLTTTLAGDKLILDSDINGLDIAVRNVRVAAIDRASPNKTAIDIVEDENGISIFRAFCVSHGTSGSGKKAAMTIGKDALNALSGMTKFKLCKARNIFKKAFGEAAKSKGGIRWGEEHEMGSQFNEIGVDALRDKYAGKCIKEGLSKESSKTFMEVTQQPGDRSVAACEIAASVDVGNHLVPETYINESDAPVIFTIYKGLTDLRVKFANGVDGFDSQGLFVNLDKRSRESAKRMEAHMVSSNPGFLFLSIQFQLTHIL